MGRTYGHVAAMLHEVTGLNYLSGDEVIPERALESYYYAETRNKLPWSGKVSLCIFADLCVGLYYSLVT